MERTQPPAPLVYTHISPPLPSSSESMEESPGKKVSEKKPGNKNFGKKSEFYQVLGKNVTGNKVLCFGFLRHFFPKIVWGLPIKSQEIRSQEKSPEEKKS